MTGLMRLRSPVEEASYIVFKDGGKIYAKSGDTGEIVASGADLGGVLQSIVNKVPDTGSATIYIKPGQYDMFSGVRVAKAGLAIIGAWMWDWLDVWERANVPQAYPGVLIRLRADGVNYFDFGWEEATVPTKPMRVVMTGIGAYASDAHGNPVQHTSSTFIYLRNRVRHSLFRQLSIVGTGYGVVHEKTLSNAEGLQGVYLEHITCEYTYTRCIDLGSGDYDVRLVDIRAGWNSVDRSLILLGGFSNIYVDRVSILAGSQRVLGIYYSKRFIVRDVIVESVMGSAAIVLSSVTDGVIDNVLVDYDGTNSPSYVIAAVDYENIEIRNVFAKYKNGTIYYTGVMPKMVNVRMLNVNTNTEYRSESRGLAVLPAGQTKVTVNHYLLGIPITVNIVPLGKPDGKLWVTNRTETSFDITTDVSQSTDLEILWYATV